MTIDPRSELHRLLAALDARATKVREADDWYTGNHPLPEPPANTSAATDLESRQAFQTMARLSVTNFLAPVVDGVASRLKLEGFRGDQSTRVWDLFKRSDMDIDSLLVFAAALRTGSAMVTVWPGDDGRPEISIEDPEQCIVSYWAGSRRKRRSALKVWVDEDGRQLATLYLADAIYKFVGPARSQLIEIAGVGGEWQPRGEDWITLNPLRVVPMVELRANHSTKAAMFGGGRPEFHLATNDQKRLNEAVLKMLIMMEHQAWRQRWVTGWDYPVLPDGSPDKDKMHRASAARLWTFYNDGSPNMDSEPIRVGEFSQADFRPLLEVIENDARAIASITYTPPYAFLLGNMINVAADSLARIEGVHIDKVRTHARFFGRDLVEIAMLALMCEGESRDAVLAMDYVPVFGEFEARTGAEQAQIAQAARGLGVPLQSSFAMLPGVDEDQAARLAREARAEQMQQGLFERQAGADAPDAPATTDDPAALKAKADALGALVRAGVEFDSAKDLVGLPGAVSSGGVPVALRFPSTDATTLEDR